LADHDARIARALQTIDRLQARLRAVEAPACAPVAVVGIGCRYPGGADSPAAFWQLLEEGRDAIGRVPADRWDAAALYDPDPAAPGRIVTREGGFVPDPQGFDAAFFGIAPREAASLDPQQRLLLEVAWEALEDAGLPPPALAGRPVGVFVGISSHDYSHRLAQLPPEAIDAYLATGNAHSVAAGRLSYSFGFIGPSVAVDTACSSSLVAVHLALQSLRAGECELALVGGVNRILSPAFGINFSRARMLAPDGRCKAFSARADGFGRGEGCGVVVLRRLADAERAGDRVRALLRGSALNQDGRSSGLTVPNGPAQQAVMRSALLSAGLAPADIQYVEAHGTGTALGDPIEAGALGAVFGAGRGREQSLHIGSVKANVGHLEAAAGLCGLIKGVLALQHGRLPAQLHALPPSPHIDWAALPLALPAATMAWPACNGPRRAGVSSFGFSGTNAHVVLEAAPPLAAAPLPDEGAGLLQLSARDAAALRALALRHADALDAGSPWRAHAAAAAQGRAALPQRLALVAGSGAEAAALLRAWAAGERVQVFSGRAAHEPLPADVPEDAPLPMLARRFVEGADPHRPGPRFAGLSLPLYPFQHQRHWVDLPAALPTPAALHPLLGRRLAVAGDTASRYEVLLDAHTPVWAAQHTVFDQVVLPAAGLVEMMLAAARQAGRGALALCGLVFRQALRLDELRRVQLLHRPDGSLEIHGAGVAPEAPWVLHAQARIDAAAAPPQPDDRLAAARATCTRPVEAEACRRRLAAQGVAYGPAFAALQSVALGDHQVLARLQLPAEHDAAAWLLHPVLLDAALQSLAAAFIDAPGESDVAWLPAVIEQLHWFASPGAACWSLATLRRGAHGDALGADLQLFADDGRLRVRIDALALRPAGAARLREAALPLWHSEWVEAPPPALPGVAVDAWPQLLQAAHSRLDDALAQPALQCYLALLPALDALARQWAARALAEAGAADPPQPALAALRRRLQMLASRAAPGDAEAEHARLLAAHAHAATELELLRHCALGLPAVLQGRREPMALLFDGGGARRLQALYGESPGARAANDLAAEFAAAWAAQQGNDRPVRVLEIGAGTGGTTAVVLPRLRQAVRTLDYQLTDLSAMLLAGARERFGDAGLQYRRLDIEQPPAAQGFDERYDIVLAANVLHATADLNVTLAHARALLAPGGLLLLLELTQPMAWLDPIFGLTEGWWRFADHALRPEHALLPAPRWLQLLQDAGLQQPALLTGEGVPFGVFAARAPSASTLALCAGSGRAEALRAGLWPQRLHWWVDDTPDAAAALLQFVQDLLQAAEAGGHALPQLSLVTTGAVLLDGELPQPHAAAAAGLARVIALEHPALRCRQVDLDPLATPPQRAECLAREASAPVDEAVIAWRRGVRWRPRLRPLPAAGDAAQADWQLLRGDQGLQRAPLAPRAPGAGEVQIRVAAAGLNFIDALDALGMLPFDRLALGLGFGAECAGEVIACGSGVTTFAPGDAVIALAPGSWRSQVTVPADWVAPAPPGLPLAAAAALPAASLTAWHALVEVAGLRAGESLLLHAAAGGTGSAALNIAQMLGATVHATASRGKWPGLRAAGAASVMDSRTLDFRDRLQADGGVDVVLNSLSGDFIPASLACLKPGGRFVEIGKRGTWSAEQVRALRPDVRYHEVDLMALAQREPARIRALFVALGGAWRGARLAPLPYRCFGFAQADAALQLMQRAGHVGKLVLCAQAPRRVRADASYLITGGFGGLGLATAAWLVGQGARHLALLGRQLRPLPEALRSAEVQVLCLQADVADAEALAAALQRIEAEMPPLRGVFHAAGVLHDGALRTLTLPRLRAVLAPKLDAAWHLHRLTQALPLGWFVLYSSAAALFGSAGQAAHVAANAGLDALAAHRHARGLAATSVQWGPWSQIGAAADPATLAALRARGVEAFSPAEGRALLDALLLGPQPQDAVVAALKLDAARLAALNGMPSPQASASPVHAADQALTALSSLPPAQRRSALVRRLQGEVAAVLGSAGAALPDPALGFFEMGLDSLMAMELRNRLVRFSGVQLSAAGIFEHPTIHALAVHLQAQLWPAAPPPAPDAEAAAAPDDAAAIAAELAALDALLAEPGPTTTSPP